MRLMSVSPTQLTRPIWDNIYDATYPSMLGGSSWEHAGIHDRRWINALEDRGLITTKSDPAEPARLWASLTSEAASSFKRLADQWGSAFVSI